MTSRLAYSRVTLQTMPHSAAPFLHEIRVLVEVRHIAAYSTPQRQLFAYIIRIENHSETSWQLLRRTWRITDALGRETVVEGEGVVGQQPVIAPRGVYIYDSLVTLEAAPGRMGGEYLLQDAWGGLGRAEVGTFVLEAGQGSGERVLN